MGSSVPPDQYNWHNVKEMVFVQHNSGIIKTTTHLIYSYA
jgi:hypothetical protein